MEVVRAVERVGSQSGKTSQPVVIADCGQLSWCVHLQRCCRQLLTRAVALFSQNVSANAASAPYVLWQLQSAHTRGCRHPPCRVIHSSTRNIFAPMPTTRYMHWFCRLAVLKLQAQRRSTCPPNPRGRNGTASPDASGQ